MTIRTILFPVAGPVLPITLVRSADSYLLSALYEALGCDMVERVMLDDRIDLIVDECGRINDSPFNRRWLTLRGGMPSGYADIFGRATVLAQVPVMQPEGYEELDWGQPSVEQLVRACSLVGGVSHIASCMSPSPDRLRAWLADGINWTASPEWEAELATLQAGPLRSN